MASEYSRALRPSGAIHWRSAMLDELETEPRKRGGESERETRTATFWPCHVGSHTAAVSKRRDLTRSLFLTSGVYTPVPNSALCR